MTQADGFPPELLGAPITIGKNHDYVKVGDTLLYSGVWSGRPTRAWWNNDVVVVECSHQSGSPDYYYYTAAQSNDGVFLGKADGCDSISFKNALERARKYRAELGAERGKKRTSFGGSNAGTKVDNSPVWLKVIKIIFKILFFPFKAIWWILTKLT